MMYLYEPNEAIETTITHDFTTIAARITRPVVYMHNSYIQESL